MDQNFAQKWSFSGHKLKYLGRLFVFDRQPVRTDNIIYITKATPVLGEHSEKLFLFIISL